MPADYAPFRLLFRFATQSHCQCCEVRCVLLVDSLYDLSKVCCETHPFSVPTAVNRTPDATILRGFSYNLVHFTVQAKWKSKIRSSVHEKEKCALRSDSWSFTQTEAGRCFHFAIALLKMSY